ncbi:MAG: hypothetical protein CVU69_07820 [Deltaproteobacteria bacterium HGW-Deltaproteobacteria-4]|nr:MAG: hypothetical protein CVU69_07820 [Deltaproteobacteria bacterium HGW-Deltaproteobacteria-4]
MLKKLILPVLLMTASTLTFSANEANAGISAQISTPNVSVNINGYLPAPPGVVVLLDSGRPYYVEREQRIYIKERPKHNHGKKKHHKKHDHGHDHD